MRVNNKRKHAHHTCANAHISVSWHAFFQHAFAQKLCAFCLCVGRLSLTCTVSHTFQSYACCKKDLKDNKHNSLHLVQNYARIFVLGHYLFLKAHSFQRAHHFSEQISSTDKYPRTFLHQMETLVYLLFILFNVYILPQLHNTDIYNGQFTQGPQKVCEFWLIIFTSQ